MYIYSYFNENENLLEVYKFYKITNTLDGTQYGRSRANYDIRQCSKTFRDRNYALICLPLGRAFNESQV